MIKRFVCLAVLVISSPLFAQIQNGANIGKPENALFSGNDIDNVQLNNRNLHIEIPLWSNSGRGGLGTSAKYGFDNKDWYFKLSCNRQGICNDAVMGGGKLKVEYSWAYGSDNKTKTGVTCAPNPGSANRYSIGLKEPDGTKHHFSPDPVSLAGNTCNLPSPTELYADDGSGWMAKFDNTTGTVLYYVRKDGLKVLASGSYEKDTNGNYINNNNGPVVDTLGRSFNLVGSYFPYYAPDGSTQSLTITNTSVPVQTALCSFSTEGDTCSEYSSTWTLPSVIQLPNGMSYQFTYAQSKYGEPISMTLPTGGQVTWTWTPTAIDSGGRGVATRTVAANGLSATWTYTAAGSAPLYSSVTVTDPAGNDTKASCTYVSDLCYVSSTQYYAGSTTSGTLLKTVATDYQTFAGNTTGSIYYRAVPIRETTTWNQQNLVTKTETDYWFYTPQITFKNVIATREYAWGAGAPGALLRTTTNTYLHITNSAYRGGVNIADRVTSTQITDGTGAQVAYTWLQYDQLAPSSSGGAPNHDAAYGPGYNTRGNLNYVSKWINTDGSYRTSENRYDDLGNLTQTTDPLNHPTYFSYTDSWSASPCAVGGNTQAFVTTSTDALGHQGKTQYNSCSTLAEKFQDQNDINAARWGKTATYDKMYRPVTITNADGGGSTFTYNDAVPYTTTNATKLDTARSVVSQTIKDGIGRLRKAILTAPEGSIYGFSTYDALGRRQFQWNPTKCDPEFNSSCAGENTFGKTETQYDALSRPIKVIHPDNGFASTSYAANCVTVTDEASKARKACTDALGNLTNVWEDPAGLNYQTDYQYDVLGNLKRVDQKGSAPSDSSQWRTRLFTYNSVSELLTANNPESGIITYGYNADGSLASRVAPAPNQLGSSTVTTTYVYDALHRLTDRYSSNPVWVAFRYDDPAFWGLPTVESVGRMVFAEEVPDGTNPTSQRFFAYDTVGRIKTVWDRRDQNLQPDITSALYDYAGNLTSFTYPSTRQVTYGYDTASRLTNVKFANFGVTPVNYDYLNVSNFHPTGAPKISNFGNATAETTTYNPRLQISGINVINASGPLLDKSYDYGSANNGNIMAINDGLDGNKTQSFIYDALNRITSGQSAATTGADAWGQSFAVDAWGNLTAQTQTKGSPPPFNAAANTKNQLVGYAYDAAGNMTNDGSHSYFYNSDNMITSADSGASTYTYDANANRVRKTTGSNLTEYLYFGSNVVAEKDQTGAWTDYVFAGGKRIVQATGSTSAGSKYFHADHLGSSRMMTDSAGTNIWSATYLPYGWEYNASGNSTHFKFSGKERDTETGLDYFGARYYSSGSGHWTSIDPVLVTPTRMLDPQRFNLYNYSRGNPLEYVDPDGKDINLVNDTQQGREQALATITKNMTEQEAANIDVRQNKDGKWEVYVKDPNAISAGDASVGYKGITGVISDHSIVANVGLIGGGLSATFSDIGKISSFSEGSAVIAPSPGSKQVSVIVTQGDHPGGVQVYCCNGRGVYQGRSPDFVTMYHELVGETLKYRAGHESLQNDPVRDSKTVIKIENEIRAFHNMNPRTGVGHGQTVITVTPQ